MAASRTPSTPSTAAPLNRAARRAAKKGAAADQNLERPERQAVPAHTSARGKVVPPIRRSG